MKDFSPKYVKNHHNSTIKRQVIQKKMDKMFEETLSKEINKYPDEKMLNSIRH